MGVRQREDLLGVSCAKVYSQGPGLSHACNPDAPAHHGSAFIISMLRMNITVFQSAVAELHIARVGLNAEVGNDIFELPSDEGGARR